MGYDCTLHVVDARMIREKFVPRLLGTSNDRCAFDERDDAEEIWSQVKGALADPIKAQTAGSYVCQLAIAYCAAEGLPYQYERGFCLSLWHDQADGLDAKIPKKLIGDASPLFDEVTALYPHLKGKYPREIESNFCPGIYVVAENVPELLAWVEKKVKRYPKPDRRQFYGLLLVLKHAAEKGLAYWEGTDLPVSMEQVEPTHRTGDAEELKFADSTGDEAGWIDDLLVLSRGPGDDSWTRFVDLSTWPPNIREVPGYTLDVARSPIGRLLSFSAENNEQYRYRARVRPKEWTDEPVVLQLDGPSNQLGVKAGGFIGERVVAFRTVQKNLRLTGTPLIELDGRLEVLEGDHPIVEDEKIGDINDRCSSGIAQLNDGSTVVIWKDQGYELRNGRLEVTFPKFAYLVRSSVRTVPWGQDGFFYIGRAEERKRSLFYARRGQPIGEPVLPIAIDTMYISPGLPGTVLITQGMNKRGDKGALYFIEENTYIPIPPELFPDEDPREIHNLYWAQRASKLIATTFYRMWALPIENVLSLPRYNAATGRKMKS